jgi:hypothetical protein
VKGWVGFYLGLIITLIKRKKRKRNCKLERRVFLVVAKPDNPSQNASSFLY